MKHIICVNMLLICMFTYCAANKELCDSIAYKLDNISRKIVRPLAVYIEPPSIYDISWGQPPLPMDDFMYVLATLEHTAFNTQFPLWSYNTKQKQINRTQKALEQISTQQNLTEFKIKATSDNTDAKCFNIASNWTTLATLVSFRISRPVIGSLLFGTAMYLKYKTMQAMPLYDLDTIEQHTVS